MVFDSLIDFAALAYFLFAWVGYSRYAKNRAQRG